MKLTYLQSLIPKDNKPSEEISKILEEYENTKRMHLPAVIIDTKKNILENEISYWVAKRRGLKKVYTETVYPEENVMVNKFGAKTYLFRRQKGCCYICGKPLDVETMDCEHLVPKCKGGKNNRTNILLAHRICNRLKGHEDLTKRLLINIGKQIQ